MPNFDTYRPKLKESQRWPHSLLNVASVYNEINDGLIYWKTFHDISREFQNWISLMGMEKDDKETA